jgi:hypothetical protein
MGIYPSCVSTCLIICQQFDGQVACTQDASLVIGIHGAGLALAVLAPTNESSLLEIVPEGFALDLFGAVTSYGLEYNKIVLSSSGQDQMSNIALLTEDDRTLESKITAMVLAGKLKMKPKH